MHFVLGALPQLFPRDADNAAGIHDGVGSIKYPTLGEASSVVFGCSSVYSFSYPNKFMLPMYNAKQHPPVTFEHSGVVSLRCNIHDHMLGYILVVDSMTVTKTDENGKA